MDLQTTAFDFGVIVANNAVLDDRRQTMIIQRTVMRRGVPFDNAIAQRGSAGKAFLVAVANVHAASLIRGEPGRPGAVRVAAAHS